MLAAIRIPEKAKKLELQALQNYKINLAWLPNLDEILGDAYAIRRPKPIEYNNRRDLVHVFNEIAKEIYGMYTCSSKFPRSRDLTLYYSSGESIN